MASEEIHISIKALNNDRGILNISLSSTDVIGDIKVTICHHPPHKIHTV